MADGTRNARPKLEKLARNCDVNITPIYEHDRHPRLEVKVTKNIQLPILMPEHYLTTEKEHVEGFAPEVAWVTKGGGKDLEENLKYILVF